MIKKIFAIIIAVIFTVSTVIFVASGNVSAFDNDGYAVPASAGIYDSLEKGEAQCIALAEVNYDDNIYSNIFGTFIGSSKTAIDTDFPVYVNGGAALRFMSEETWLISSDLDIVQSFEGLYLSEGNSFNQDLSVADPDEFVLLSVKDNLYINAQEAVFKNNVTQCRIPLNSIVFLGEDCIRWYSFSQGALHYENEGSVAEAVLIIGDNEYDYSDLLKALNILSRAEELARRGKNPDSVIEEAQKLINNPARKTTEKYTEESSDTALDTAAATAASSATETQYITEVEEEELKQEQKPEIPDNEDETNEDETEEADLQNQTEGGTDADDAQAIAVTVTDEDESKDRSVKDKSEKDSDADSSDSDTSKGSQSNNNSSGSKSNTNTAGSQGSTGTSASTGNTGSASSSGSQSGGSTSGSKDSSKTAESQSKDDSSDSKESSKTDESESKDSGSDSKDNTGSEESSDKDDSAGSKDNTSGETKKDNDESQESGGGSSEKEKDKTGTGESTKNDTAGESENKTSSGAISDSDSEHKSSEQSGTSGSAVTDSKEHSTEYRTGEAADLKKGGEGSGSDSSETGESGDEEGEEDESEEGPVSDYEYEEEVPYQDPVVNLNSIEAWSYAIGAKLDLNDPASAVISGIRVTVYQSKKANKIGAPAATVTEGGIKIFDSEYYKGEKALMRKVYYGSQSFALSSFEPGSTVYIQYSYKYNKIDEVANTISRQSYSSPLYEIKLLSLSEAPLCAVSLDWTEEFAQHNSRMVLSDFALRNTSDYVESKRFSFDNYKLNSLPYVNRVSFNLVKEGSSKSITLNTKSSEITSAISDAGTRFLSDNLLEPGSKYAYTVACYDKYGNDISFILGKGYSGYIYTAKDTPLATISIPENGNAMDAFTVNLDISDDSSALVSGGRIAFQIYEGLSGKDNAQPVVLSGIFSDGSSISSALDQDESTLYFKGPGTYSFTLYSLAYSTSFSLRVYADYNLTPDSASGQSLEDEYGEIGNAKAYTASLASGNVSFTTRLDSIGDSFASLCSNVSDSTTAELIPVIDRLKFSVYEKAGENSVAEFAIDYEDLNKSLASSGFSYSAQDGKTNIVLKNAEAGGFGVSISADSRIFSMGYTIWESLFINQSTDEEYENACVYLEFPAGSLTRSRTYKIKISAFAKKGNSFVEIPTKSVIDEFSTYRTKPSLSYGETMVSASKIIFNDVAVSDADNTLSGNLYASLYDNGTLISRYELSANAEAVMLDFENLSPHRTYDLIFTADAYYPSMGYEGVVTDYQLDSFSITTSEDGLNGEINLTLLNYEDAESEVSDYIVNLSGSDITALESAEGLSKWTRNTASYTTGYFELPEGTTFVEIDNLGIADPSTSVMVSRTYSSVVLNSDGSIKATECRGGTYGFGSSPNLMTVGGTTPLFAVYTGSRYIRFELPLEVNETGFRVRCYQTASTRNLWAQINEPQNGISYADSWQYYDVSPGDIYTFDSTYASDSRTESTHQIRIYDEQGLLISEYNTHGRSKYIVPDRVAKLAVKATGNTSYARVYKVCDSDKAHGFRANIAVNVIDRDNYLMKSAADGSTYASVSLVIEKSDNINQPVYSFYDEKTVSLTEGINGWYYDGTEILKALPYGCSWNVKLCAEYKGESICLDSLSFDTDMGYVSIASNREFLQVQDNPYGNYLVISDFTHYIDSQTDSYLYGTIDFQGHTVSKSSSAIIKGAGQWSNRWWRASLISYNYGTIKNLVYEYPSDYSNYSNIVYYNYGTIEDVIIRNNGNLYIDNDHGSLLGRYNYGIIRNFIFEIYGDIVVQSSGNFSVGVYVTNNMGNAIIENGYVISRNNSGILFNRTGSSNKVSGALVYLNESGGRIRNIYSIFNLWLDSGNSAANANCAALVASNQGSLTNAYHVGEYYILESMIKSYLPVKSEYLANGTSFYNTDNLWHVSDNSYASNGYVNLTSFAQLYDESWQNNVLGSAFVIADNISVGLYPRLSMTLSMEVHQPYTSLPGLGIESMPVPVGDSWLEDPNRGHDNDGGYIVIKFRDPMAYPVSTIEIDGLLDYESGSSSITVMGESAMNNDGLYCAVCHVKASSYYSTYKLTGFTYISAGAAVEANTKNFSYSTEYIEFWKSVSNAADWDKINSHMDWNYILTSDIDFEGVNEGAIKINGKQSDTNSKKAFTGKIKGEMHTLSNIKLLNQAVPCVFYQLGSSASSTGNNARIENLIINGLWLETGSSTEAQTGFIAAAEYADIVNVHIRNASYKAMGKVGCLVGKTGKFTSFENCSVAESSAEDLYSSMSLYIGGIAGYCSESTVSIRNCYVRDLAINVDDALTVYGIGGIAGYLKGSVSDVYATGKFEVNGNYVGGIYGNSESAKLNNAWSNVTLDVLGNNVGGIGGVGSKGGTVYNVFAAGNIVTNSTYAHRLFGTSYAVTLATAHCAYDNQKIYYSSSTDFNNSVDNDDCYRLFSWQEMHTASMWTDFVVLGDYFDCQQVLNGYYPKLYTSTSNVSADSTELVYGQTDIHLPDEDEDTSVTVDYSGSAIVDGKTHYQATIVISGSGYTDPVEFKNAIINGDIELSVDGMRTTDGLPEYSISENGGRIIVAMDFSDKSSALDSYRLVYKCGEQSALKLISFGGFVYWDVSNLTEWNTVMTEHADSYENIRITGQVNFAGAGTQYINLKMNRLVGNGADGNGFYNLYYDGGLDADPWISNVNEPIANLCFCNIDVDLSQNSGAGKTVRDQSGLFLNVQGIDSCSFKDISISLCKNSSYSAGFFSAVFSTAENIDIDGLELDYCGANCDSSNQSKNLSGGLIATLYDGFSNISAKNININLPKFYYIGGLIGDITNSNSSGYVSNNLSASAITINALSNAGGVVCYSSNPFKDCSINGVNITVEKCAAGFLYYMRSSVVTRNISGSNLNITATSKTAALNNYVGGLFGQMWNITAKVYDCSLESSVIRGNGSAGGIMAFSQRTGIYSSYVIDSEISVYDSTVEFKDGTSAVGSICGQLGNNGSEIIGCSARNCIVKGVTRVGGLAGSSGGFIQYSYCAEDVVVSGYSYVGGITGRQVETYTGAPYLNVACGATVNGCTNVGGISGYLPYFKAKWYKDGYNTSYLRNVYYAGNINVINESGYKYTDSSAYNVAGDYIGGIAGRWDNNSSSSPIAATAFGCDNVLFAGNVQFSTTAGAHVSLFANRSFGCSDADRGKFFVYENSEFNSQKAADILAANPVEVPCDGGALTASELCDTSVWQDTLGFSVYAWDFSHMAGNITLEDIPAGKSASDDYIYVDRIMSNKGEVIDLGYAPNSSTRIETKLQLSQSLDLYTSDIYLWGVVDSVNGFNYTAYCSGPNSASDGFIGINIGGKSAGCNLTTDSKHTLVNEFRIESAGIVYGSASAKLSPGNGQSSYSMALFGVNQNGVLTPFASHSNLAIYSYFRIYEGSSLVMDLRPCIRKSDGVIGLHDLVGGGFYSNDNAFSSGLFTAASLNAVNTDIRYMPYPVYSTRTVDYSYYSSGLGSYGDVFNAGCGIALPGKSVVQQSFSVYASGVDSINIEALSDAEIYVKYGSLDAKQFTIVGGEAISLSYDFCESIWLSVDGVNYSCYPATDLRKDLCVYGTDYYYINTDGSVGVGIGPTVIDYAVTAGAFSCYNCSLAGTTALHVFDGQLMADDGYVYSFDKSSKSFISGAARTSNLEQISPARPFATGSAAGVDVDIFMNYSIRESSPVQRFPYRLYSVASGSESLATAVLGGQDIVYDSVNLYRKTSDSSYTNYICWLESDGRLVRNWTVTDFDDSEIKCVSLGMSSPLPVMLVRYNDNEVVFVNYAESKSESVYKEPAVTSFGMLLGSYFSSLFAADDSEDGYDDSGELESSLFTLCAAVPLNTASTEKIGSTGDKLGTQTEKTGLGEDASADGSFAASADGSAGSDSTALVNGADGGAAASSESVAGGSNNVAGDAEADGDNSDSGDGQVEGGSTKQSSADNYDNASVEVSDSNNLNGDGSATDGSSDADGKADVNGIAETSGDSLADGQSDANGSSDADGVSSADGSSGANGSADANGTSDADGTAEASDAKASDGTSTDDGTSDADGIAETGDGLEDDETSNSVSASGSDDSSAVSGNSVADDNSETGTASGGSSSSAASSEDSDEETSSDSSDNTSVTYVYEEHGLIVSAANSNGIRLWNEKTKTYTVCKAEEILSSDIEAVLENAASENNDSAKQIATAEKSEEKLTEDQDSDKSSDFSLKGGALRNLSAEEKTGAGMIVLIVAASLAALLVLYLIVIRRKK